MSKLQIDIIFELVGIVPATLVLLSYIFKDLIKLRIVNMAASIAFVGYGFGIVVRSGWCFGWTTVVLNLACAIVHIVYLVRYYSKKKSSSQENSEKSVLDVIAAQAREGRKEDTLSTLGPDELA